MKEGSVYFMATRKLYQVDKFSNPTVRSVTDCDSFPMKWSHLIVWATCPNNCPDIS